MLSQVLIDELTERQGTPAAALSAHVLERPLERLARVPLGRETTPLHTSRAAATHPIAKRPPSLSVAATPQPEHLTFLQHHDHSSRPTERVVQPRLHISSSVTSVAAKRMAWVLLAYRLPRDPSTPRSALWRKLRRLGAAQVLDGLAALPLDARNREQLEWLADEVIEAGGEATIWVGELTSAAQERELATRMAEAVAAEYRALIDDATAARAERPGPRRRTLGRLRRELRRIRARDHFPPAERELAQQEVEELAALVEEPVG